MYETLWSSCLHLGLPIVAQSGAMVASMASEIFSLRINVVGDRGAGRSFTLRVGSRVNVQKIARSIGLKFSVRDSDVLLYRCKQALRPGGVPIDQRKRLSDVDICSDATLECIIDEQVGMCACALQRACALVTD